MRTNQQTEKFTLAMGKKTLQIPVTDSVIFIGISQNDKIIAGFQWLIGSISAYIGAYE